MGIELGINSSKNQRRREVRNRRGNVFRSLGREVERSLGILGGNRLDIYSKVGITWIGLLVLWNGAHGEYFLCCLTLNT